MTITSTAPTISSTGISAPTYSDILEFLQVKYQGIYGADVYLGPDSQDGQFLAVIAQALSDANAAAVAVYNSFSPATAQGAALSSNVKINGITRNVASYSTVDVTLTGQAGTTITNGVVTDTSNNRWSLPASVVIPSGGSITVTATCQTIGAVVAAAGTVNTIATPTRGWQSVTNASAASAGDPVELDPELRVRQSDSTALPSQSILDGIVGGVKAIAGVTRVAAHENDTGSTDADGVPANSIALVVEGGDAVAIATELALKKTPGTPTYGTTSEPVTDPYGDAQTINFYRPTNRTVKIAIGIKSLTGYNSTIGDAIVAALVAYVNALPIGGDVLLSRLYLPANLFGGANSSTFEVTSLLIALDAGTPSSSDLTLAFNEAAVCATGNVTLTVT